MNTDLKCGHRISGLTLGTVQLGLAYGVNNDSGMPTFEQSSAILNTALDSGIVSFDTARAYGESERVLGRFFKDCSRERTIISKVLITDVDKAALKDRMFADVRDSLGRLGIEKLPFLKLHNESMLIKYGDAVISALHDLKREGLVDGIGVSFSDKARLLELADGAGFDCVQIPANMFDNKEITDGTLSALAKQGVAVFVRSLYLQGLFFKDTDALPEKIKSAKPALDRLHALSRECGVSMAEMAITFIRDTEGITSLVLGCDNSEQLLESVSLVGAPRMSDSLREEILKISEQIEPIVVRPWEWFK